MTIREFIKKKPYLFWHTEDLDSLSEDAIVEAVLNYGDFDDVKKMIQIVSIERVAAIFGRQIRRRRCNYDPRIKHYFKLYFKKHAHGSSCEKAT